MSELEQEHKRYKEALEKIRGWVYTSKGSCDILRGFARIALEKENSTQEKEKHPNSTE